MQSKNLGQGALCSNCSTTAVACQHIFVDSDENKKKWCCLSCQTRGPRELHTVVAK